MIKEKVLARENGSTIASINQFVLQEEKRANQIIGELAAEYDKLSIGKLQVDLIDELIEKEADYFIDESHALLLSELKQNGIELERIQKPYIQEHSRTIVNFRKAHVQFVEFVKTGSIYEDKQLIFEYSETDGLIQATCTNANEIKDVLAREFILPDTFGAMLLEKAEKLSKALNELNGLLVQNKANTITGFSRLVDVIQYDHSSDRSNPIVEANLKSIYQVEKRTIANQR